ncbi:hypothetical protein JCM10207_002913 [Rhodosporidiobolus poonsookiae]
MTVDQDGDTGLLLGDSSFPPLRAGGRRFNRSLLLVVLGGALVSIAALHGSTPTSGLHEHLHRLTGGYWPGAGSERLPAVDWSPEDRILRDYSWQEPEPHDSLTRHVERLSPSERRTWDWLYRTRRISEGGTGIGLGAEDPPRPVRPGMAAEEHVHNPGENEGPGFFTSGSRAKYNDLIKEWKTGRPVAACDKGTWEDEYAEMHADMLSGKREPYVLEFFCHAGGWCGGFADRMLGIITTFLYAIVSKRAFALTWEQPTAPDLVFDSPYIDWSRPFNESSTTPERFPYSNDTFFETAHSIQAHDWPVWEVDTFFPEFEENFGAGKNASWLQMDINRGVAFRSFYYDKVGPKLEGMGLRFTTIYSCLMKYLFRPKQAALDFITHYTSLFALPEYFTVGIQIRTGDIVMFLDESADLNNVTHHEQYWTCAEQLAKRYAHPSQKVVYYLVTDSHHLEHSALEAMPDRIVVTGLGSSHDEIKYKDKSGAEVVHGAAGGFIQTVIESWIFAATDYQILTYRSGFGKIPTWMRGRDHTTVQLFNPYLDYGLTEAVKAGNGGVLPPPPDCSKPTAFKSFADLAQSWSLG